ncbi:ATP-dependent DNA helicase RecQ-like [Argopecten irradians]|uniref:ATP-dependent DNA helicase RecQ-like n=1 Tax=Argopecten irradians TaxID=31199 RepID=UPI0037194C3A
MATKDILNKIVSDYEPGLVLKEKQSEALECLCNERCDLLVNLPVGYGKSIIFHLLPKLFIDTTCSNPIIVVVSPLNIIQKDQLESMKKRGISACKLDIKTKVDETTDTLDDVDLEKYDVKCDVPLTTVINGEYSIILCHPEALLNTTEGKGLLSNERFTHNVKAVVIDECHIIQKWGEEFRTAFGKMSSLKVFFPSVPFIALSGTLTVKQKKEIPALLHLENCKLIEHSPDKRNIFFEKCRKESSEDRLGEYEKIRTIKELKVENPRIRLVLTTSIAGMGFDPRNVTQVIHTCPPRNISQYMQEIGRAGRQGQPARAVLYFNNHDIAKNLPGITEDIIVYCKNDTTCLRNAILNVFGFEKDQSITATECCSNCKSHSREKSN